MLNDFDMIVHHFDSDVDIYPIADVHLGALEHAQSEWETFLKKVVSENAYVILDGDLLNNGIRSCKFVNPFEEVYRPREAKRMMVEYLEPIKDRILAVTTGNHERRTYKDDDQDITYDICAKLDIEHLYRENIAYMKIGLGNRSKSRGKYNCAYTFAITHGGGGGIYTGAGVNRDERFGNVIEGLDCLVVGHVHKGFITKPSKIVINTEKESVRMSHYTVISCVSWLNYGGYAAQKMLLPAYSSDPQKIHIANSKTKKLTATW